MGVHLPITVALLWTRQWSASVSELFTVSMVNMAGPAIQRQTSDYWLPVVHASKRLVHPILFVFSTDDKFHITRQTGPCLSCTPFHAGHQPLFVKSNIHYSIEVGFYGTVCQHVEVCWRFDRVEMNGVCVCVDSWTTKFKFVSFSRSSPFVMISASRICIDIQVYWKWITNKIYLALTYAFLLKLCRRYSFDFVLLI